MFVLFVFSGHTHTLHAYTSRLLLWLKNKKQEIYTVVRILIYTLTVYNTCARYFCSPDCAKAFRQYKSKNEYIFTESFYFESIRLKEQQKGCRQYKVIICKLSEIDKSPTYFNSLNHIFNIFLLKMDFGSQYRLL